MQTPLILIREPADIAAVRRAIQTSFSAALDAIRGRSRGAQYIEIEQLSPVR